MNKDEHTKPQAVVLKVTTGLKAGRLAGNHNRRAAQGSTSVAAVLKVTTGLKAGRIAANHNRRML
jgi:hypothetical protein